MRKYLMIASLFLSVFLTGCGVDKRNPSDRKTYLLDVNRSDSLVANTPSVCLTIHDCKVATPFSGRSLVYRSSRVHYEQDYYNLFLTSPDIQITEAIQQWLSRAGYSACDDETGMMIAPFVEIFCADFEKPDEPFAMVQVRFEITISQKPPFCKVFESQVLLSEIPTAEEIVEGLSQALTTILEDLEMYLKTENTGS